MPKYIFGDDQPAQHLAGVVVETSEEIADRIPGLKSGGGGKTASAEKRAAPEKRATKTVPKSGG